MRDLPTPEDVARGIECEKSGDTCRAHDSEWPCCHPMVFNAAQIIRADREAVRADERSRVAAEIRAVAANPERRRPMTRDAQFPTDLANDFEWCAMIAENFSSRGEDDG